MVNDIARIKSLPKNKKISEAKRFYERVKKLFMDEGHFRIFKFGKPLSSRTDIFVKHNKRYGVIEYIVLRPEYYTPNLRLYYYPDILVGVDTDTGKLFALDVTGVIRTNDDKIDDIRGDLGFKYHIEEVGGVIKSEGTYRIQGDIVMVVEKTFNDYEDLIKYLTNELHYRISCSLTSKFLWVIGRKIKMELPYDADINLIHNYGGMIASLRSIVKLIEMKLIL